MSEELRETELWQVLDWSLWGNGLADTLRCPMADVMVAALTDEQREQAEACIKAWHERRGPSMAVGVGTQLERERDEARALLAEKDATIERLNAKFAYADSGWSAAHTDLDAADDEVISLRNELAEKDAEIAQQRTWLCNLIYRASGLWDGGQPVGEQVERAMQAMKASMEDRVEQDAELTEKNTRLGMIGGQVLTLTEERDAARAELEALRTTGRSPGILAPPDAHGVQVEHLEVRSYSDRFSTKQVVSDGD